MKRVYVNFATALSIAALAFSFPSLASTKTKLKSVTVNLSLEGEQEVGDSAPTNLMTYLNVPDDANYKITDADWTNSDSDEWQYGSIPTMEITVEPKNSNYEFSSGLKVHVDSDTKMKSASIKRNGSDEATVTIKLKSVGGGLAVPDDIGWKSTYVASWDSVDGRKNYQVKLYRGGSLVTTVTTNSTSYNFSADMNRTGDYTFKVRAVASKSSENSEWSDESDEMEITTSNVSNGTVVSVPSQGTQQTAPGVVNVQPTTAVQNTTGLAEGWHQDGNGWFYIHGSKLLTNTWLRDADYHWYHLGQNGYMSTGWYHDYDGKWYFLKTNVGGPYGSMATGLYTINNKNYYFSETAGGPYGSMVTGLTNINGQQHYLGADGQLMW